MVYDPEKHHRHSIRWQGYDYSLPGGYSVTVCTPERACILGEVVGSELRLSEYGMVARECLSALPAHYDHVSVDCCVIMPNHVHAIIVLGDYDDGDSGAGFETRPYSRDHVFSRHGLPEIVRGFKTYSARAINQLRESPGRPVWQRSFYDRVIRDEREWLTYRWYIEHNPARWAEDRDFRDQVSS